jgi:hypothetical protein
MNPSKGHSVGPRASSLSFTRTVCGIDVMSSSGSSENGDYVSRDDEESEKRYPLHDCCEFEDIEALKVRLLAVATFGFG